MHYETLAFDETLSSSKFQTATDENVTLITGANGGEIIPFLFSLFSSIFLDSLDYTIEKGIYNLHAP